MLRIRLSQMLIYSRVNSAFRKAHALPEEKISNFEIDSRTLLDSDVRWERKTDKVLNVKPE